MNKDEIFAFLRSHPVFQLATVEGTKPHVRTISLYSADEDGIVFYTHTSKDLHKQLTANPQVELCFARIQPAAEIRVSGSVELLGDEEMKKQIDPNSPETEAVYQMKNARATSWTKETALEPKTYVDL